MTARNMHTIFAKVKSAVKNGASIATVESMRYLRPIMRRTRIAVIGGGIIGITTALHLRERGFQTTLYTDLRADKNHDRNKFPQFASLYPAACIVPHSVEMPDLLDVFDRSQRQFAREADNPESGVRWQAHYELGCDENPVPAYTRLLRRCEFYRPSERTLRFDKALGRTPTGWSSDVLFAETPTYIRFLYQRYLLAGGEIATGFLRREAILTLKEDLVVNCTGIWSRSLFGDEQVYPLRGHLIFVECPHWPPLKDGGSFSYNYKPPDEEFQYDIYFFPRKGLDGVAPAGWLLGGTREEPEHIGGEPWRFPKLSCPLKDGSPAPIYNVNRKILHTLTGIDLRGLPWHGYFGYRPARNGGVRLQLDTSFGRTVIHNYGHGGAGVALSWGCAERVYEIAQST